jgi:hypothetical protein
MHHPRYSGVRLEASKLETMSAIALRIDEGFVCYILYTVYIVPGVRCM